MLNKNIKVNDNNKLVYKGQLVDHLNGILPSSSLQGALFLGSIEALSPKTLGRLNIRAVVSAVKQRFELPPCVDDQLVVPVEDDQAEHINQYFQKVFKFVQQARKRSNVLIHCQAGISRSATLAISYLMRRFGWAVSQAYDLVKRRRIVACPNLSFCKQLLEYQKQIVISEDWVEEEGQVKYRPPVRKFQEDISTTDDLEVRQSIALPTPRIRNLRQSCL